jgi:hypothetical protein
LARIRLDTNQWPIAVVTPEGVATTEELSEFFAAYTAMLRARREAYVLIIDLRRSADMPAAQRKVLTDYMKKQEDVVRMRCAGTALIFESAVMRAVLTAIFWVKQPPQEVRVFGNVQEAVAWGGEALARRRHVA